MRVVLQIGLCCCLLASSAMAQRRGGGMGGGFRGGMASGGFHGGIGASGSHFRGIGANGFTGFRFNNGFGGFRFGGPFLRGSGFVSAWPSFGFYGSYPYDYYPYDGGYAYNDPYYQQSPNVTVVYPPAQQQTPVYTDHAQSVMRQYDEYGQEINRSSGRAEPPVYLIAFKDHAIHAATSYRVDGQTLHYVTLEHEERQAPLDTVDRDFSTQLNRERRVPFQLQ